jgi:hypothetical protein
VKTTFADLSLPFQAGEMEIFPSGKISVSQELFGQAGKEELVVKGNVAAFVL